MSNPRSQSPQNSGFGMERGPSAAFVQYDNTFMKGS
jgi:hypothetical protein